MRTFGVAVGALFIGLWLIPSAGAAVDRPHAAAIKLGYHVYPASSYFDFSSANLLGGTKEFRGQSLELDYTYRWTARWGVNIALGGYFKKYTPQQNFQQSLLTRYLTLTPIYTVWGSGALAAWALYAGVGIGQYGLTQRFDSPTRTDEFNNSANGLHTIVGTEFRVSEGLGIFVESKYARARLLIGEEIAGVPTRIDLGGFSVLIGTRFHF